MALLQVVKNLTPLRRNFQRWWISGWIAAIVSFLVQQVDATTRTQLASAEMPESALQPAAALAERSLPSRMAPFETG